MTGSAKYLFGAIFGIVLVASGQSSSSPASEQPPVTQSQPAVIPNPEIPNATSPLQPLLDFKSTDIKFNLSTFMDILKDHNHEGWVLAAYPDPATSKPLIGAGFSLDVAATDHPQRDPLNPHPFIEPSSAQLWQAAGLDPDLLKKVLDQFNHNMDVWGTKIYRKKIKTHSLPPQLTTEEGMKLLRISAIQAIENAHAYCRDFDKLTASQQMALSHLVFQMGVNLEEFTQFLSVLNGDPSPDGSLPTTYTGETERWKAAQRTLIESQWARHYSNRAASVIAMFSPDYVENPNGAVRQVALVLRPPKHRRKKLSTVALHNSAGKTSGRKKRRLA